MKPPVTSISARLSPPSPQGEGANQPLAELLELLSEATSELQAWELAVSRVAEGMGAQAAVLVDEHTVLASYGFDHRPLPAYQLLDAARRALSHTSLPGLGALDVTSAPVRIEPTGSDAAWLVVARQHANGFAAHEAELLRGAARALGLSVRAIRAIAQQQALERRGEREVRHRKLVERELAHQAFHDRLTGLANRHLMRERTDHALQNAADNGGVVAALFIDLDHFKVADDSLDHRRGDKLLLLIAHRLSELLALKTDDACTCTLGRQGGDEFIVLCEDLVVERDAVAIAQQVHAALRAPFRVNGQPISITASIGIAFAGNEGDDSPLPDADALLRDADVALSRAKERGRDRYEIFDIRMRRRLLDRVTLEASLRAGLERGELCLLYQPVVTVSSGNLVAAEALVRWRHPERGLLAPGSFIPVAEESDLIIALGEWVIDEACEQIARWRNEHPAELGVRVSVNVSARQLSPSLVETVAAALRRTGIDPDLLALELTESVLIEHADTARELLAALKALGVAIVLDDFGTGYSSLSYLNEFPLDQLKLDRSFISELAEEPRSAKIIAATIDMARALGMTVVAEGVETADQLEVLRRLGCDYAQGFMFAKPEPPGEVFKGILRAHERDRAFAAKPASPAPRFLDARSGANAAERAEATQRRHQIALGRMAGWLFIVGGTLAIPADLVMGAPSTTATILLTLMGVLTGVAILAAPWERASAGWLHVVAALATIEVTVSVLSVGRHASVLTTFYLLIAAAVAYGFTDRREIAAQVSLIVVAMAVPLLVSSDRTFDSVPRTIVSILVMLVMAAVIVFLRERMERSAADLRELATCDPLTEVGNYRLLHERLEYELVRHARERGQLTVLLIDLDRFKQVNERLGHAAGDDVLRRGGRTLSEAVRQQDTVARQGGDEFAVLAPCTDSEGAAMLASRVRDRLARVQFAGDCVAATIGWAVYPEDGASAQALLARADEALLAGKLRSHLDPRV